MQARCARKIFQVMLVCFFVLMLIGCGESGSSDGDEGETGEEVVDVGSLSLSTSKASIPTNGTDSADITATVLDSNNAAVEGATVTFTTSGGQLSSPSQITDTDGEVTVSLRSGSDKANQTVVVTATAENQEATIPISLFGTELSITPDNASFSTGDFIEFAIEAQDSNDQPIFDAGVDVSLVSGPSDLTFSPAITDTLRTNNEGKIVVRLTSGSAAGVAVIEAEGMGASVQANYQIGASEEIFQITEPSSSPFFSPANGDPVDITVQGGGMEAGDVVVFSSSFGSWTGSQEAALTSPGGSVTRSLQSTEAGVATVQVYDKNDPDTSATKQISFFNPANKAYGITIESSQGNMPPSTGTSEYSITITAKVVDDGNAPVGNAVVDFSLGNTTGGGEYLSPVSVVTDPSGIAETTFTSGTIGTGSEEDDAVLIRATVATPAHPTEATRYDEVPVVIGGVAANISIGFASEIQSNEDNTQYLLPVSVLVADTNGNPVSGKLVSLGLRPSFFRTGRWVESTEGWVIFFENPCLGASEGDRSKFVNEDLNGNAFLDEDEDEATRYTSGQEGLPAFFEGYSPGVPIPGLENGSLTPGQSTAGNIPASVETDQNGVASFTLRYQKEYAIWIEAQITATATVFGTENITKARRVLPYATDEEEDIANAFPTSPFNTLECTAAE